MDRSNGIEIYHRMEKFIKDTLYSSGLTTDDNYPPLIQDKGKEIVIRIIAKPVGTRVDIYSGMKQNSKTITDVKGMKIRAESILQNKK